MLPIKQRQKCPLVTYIKKDNLRQKSKPWYIRPRKFLTRLSDSEDQIFIQFWIDREAYRLQYMGLPRAWYDWMTNTFHFTFSPPYMTTGKIIALTIWTFVGKMMSLLFITLSRFLITFLQFSSKASHLTSHSRMSNHTFMVIHVIKTNFI